MGDGDLHDISYDHLEVTVPLTKDPVIEETGAGNCNYEFKLYPSETFEGETNDNLPIIASVASASVFLAIALAFLAYDGFVSKRNSKIVDAAAKSNAIILSLFPAHVRDKLMKTRDWGNMSKPHNDDMEDFLGSDHSVVSGTFPAVASESIAELFPSASGASISLAETASNFRLIFLSSYLLLHISPLLKWSTVLFGKSSDLRQLVRSRQPFVLNFDVFSLSRPADIAGFTAWSSTREPAQVFQ